MLCVRAPFLEKQLITLSKLTGKTKSHYVRTALYALLNGAELQPLLSEIEGNENAAANGLLEPSAF